MAIKGKVFVYGDNVNTDVIIPARYLTAFDDKTLAEHCMEDIDKNFASAVKKGDIIVAGDNFGSGSSREHAPRSLKAAGVQAIIAKSFARIFYRNSINIGLLVIEDEQLASAIKDAKEISIDYDKKQIKVSDGRIYNFELPDFVINILEAGGLTAAVISGGFNV